MNRKSTLKEQNMQSPNTPRTSLNISSFESSIRRKLEYRQLLEDGAILLDKAAEGHDTDKTFDEIHRIIEKSNEIHMETRQARVKTATEQVMDASVVKLGHEVLHTMVKNFGEQEFNGDLYVNAIMTIIGPDMNWTAFAEQIFAIPKVTLTQPCLLGTFKHDAEHAPKAPKERVVRQRATVAALKNPEQVDAMKEQEKGAQLLSMVKDQVHDAWQRHGDLLYMDVITDPKDYMATVDNAFQISFLIRDNFLGVYLDTDNEIRLKLIEEQEETQSVKSKKSRKQESVPTVQAIMTLSVAKWRAKAKELKGKKPLIDIDRSEFWKDDANITQK